MSVAVAERPMGPDVKGGLQDYKVRLIEDGPLAGGMIAFEQAPVGYLTKAGKPRQVPWRAYYWTPAPDAEKRPRQVSVTTMLDSITGKGGLPPWYEMNGIIGAHEANRRGLVDAETPDTDVVDIVRANRLGADAARDEAATRGLNLHDLLEYYMTTGNAPRTKGHPREHWPFIRDLNAFLLKYDPEPVMVEELVASPEDGYAGRMDLLCRIGAQLVAIDLKTQRNGGIYLQAHAQLALYIRAHVACGGEPPDRGMVVVLSDGGPVPEPMELAMTEADALKALAWYAVAKPVESLCESHNRAEKKARQEVVPT